MSPEDNITDLTNVPSLSLTALTETGRPLLSVNLVMICLGISADHGKKKQKGSMGFMDFILTQKPNKTKTMIFY